MWGVRTRAPRYKVVGKKFYRKILAAPSGEEWEEKSGAVQVITNTGKIMSFLFFLQEGIDTIYLDNTFFFRDFKFQTRQVFLFGCLNVLVAFRLPQVA